MMKRKLLLFLDVNQTILVIDHAAGKNLSDGINCALARAAWVRHVGEGSVKPNSLPAPPFSDFRWHDGSPLIRQENAAAEGFPALVRYGGPDRAVTVDPFTFLDQPPSGCHCYYDVFGKEVSRKFTLEGPGVMYRPLADKLMEVLRWPSDKPYSQELVTEHEGEKYHIVVPSLFRLLIQLKSQGRDFRVILSTMGHNISTPAEVLECFAQNNHPVFADAAKDLDFGDLRCLDDVHWTLNVDSSGPSQYRLESGRDGDDARNLRSEEAIYSFLADSSQACGVKSSFQRWEGGGFLAAAGKRLWFTADDTAVHPILFDDNIKQSADSVVAVRARQQRGDPFVTLAPAQTAPLHDAVLLQADIVQAILNPDYFIESVAKCEANMEQLLLDPQFRASLG